MNMNQKKWIIVGGVLVALAALAVGLYLVFFAPPTRQDYTAAKATAEKIKEYKGTTLLREYSQAVIAERRQGKTQGAIVEAVADEKKKITDALQHRSDNAAKIESSRVLRDDETKKAFEVYAAREARYSAYIRNYADSYPTFVSSFVTCDKIFEVTKRTQDPMQYGTLHKEASKDCLEDLNLLASSKIPPFASFAKEFRRIANERQKSFDGVANGSIAPSAATTTMRTLAADVSKNDPLDALKKYGNEAVFNGELDKLIAVLDAKAKAAN